MAAYVIASVTVKDSDGYEEYRQHTLPSLQPFGGKFIVRGGPVDILEGQWQPKRLVIIEFESIEKARSWYNSAEYTRIKAIRQRTAETDMIMVEGV